MLVAFLALAVVIVGTIYVRTDSFGRLLEVQISNLLATSYRGEVTLGRIDTSIWGALTIHELKIKLEDAQIVRIPRIQLHYSVIPLLWHEARIEIIVVEPTINLQRESDGEWNLLTALASKSQSPASSSSHRFTIYVDRLSIRSGVIELAPRGAHGLHYRFEATNLDADIAIASAGLKAELTELRTHVVAPGMPPADLNAALSYSSARGSTKIGINALSLTTQTSALSIVGGIRNVERLDGDVTVTVNKLAASDLLATLPNYPLREDISGRIRLKGTANAMRGEAAFAADNARFEANLQGDLTRKVPTVKGYLSLAHFDLSTLALPEKLAGTLDLSIDGRGEGADLQALIANAKINIEALQVERSDLGNFDFIGDTRNGKVQFNGNLTKGPGRLNLGGTAIVIGNPRYRAVVKTEHFNTAEILRSAPLTDLNSQTVIQGSGSDLKKIHASVNFRAVRSTVDRLPLESAIQARIDAERIDISQAEILSQGATIGLKGSFGIEPGTQTKLTYQVRAEQIAPWLKFAKMTGNGRLILDGTVSG